jgi:hypothetical protein
VYEPTLLIGQGMSTYVCVDETDDDDVDSDMRAALPSLLTPGDIPSVDASDALSLDDVDNDDVDAVFVDDPLITGCGDVSRLLLDAATDAAANLAAAVRRLVVEPASNSAC